MQVLYIYVNHVKLYLHLLKLLQPGQHLKSCPFLQHWPPALEKGITYKSIILWVYIYICRLVCGCIQTRLCKHTFFTSSHQLYTHLSTHIPQILMLCNHDSPSHWVTTVPSRRTMEVTRVPAGQIHWYDPTWLTHWLWAPVHNNFPWTAALMHSSTSVEQHNMLTWR